MFVVGVPGGSVDEQARKVAEDKFNFTFYSLTDQVNVVTLLIRQPLY